MLKKSLLTLGATLLSASVLFMVYGIVEKIIANKAIVGKRQTLSLPTLFKTDSSKYILTSNEPLLLIHFNSECEHCRYELADLKRNLRALQQTKVVLMSSENISTIKKTASDFGVEQFSNVDFVKINRDDVYDNFGALSTPHILIYGKDRRLVKEFRGEAKIEAILQYLPK